MELVSEFFYDLIRRVVPGGFILALYPMDGLRWAAWNEPTTATLLALGVAAAAWLIGATVELITFAPLALVFMWGSKEWRDKGRKWTGDFGDYLDGPPHPNPTFQRQVHKAIAEKIMFRCLLAVSLFALFVRPHNPLWGKWYPDLFAWALPAALGLAYACLRRCDQLRSDDKSMRQEKSLTAGSGAPLNADLSS